MSLISRIPLIGFALNLFADIFCLHGTMAFVDLAAFDGTIYRICSIIARILVFGAIAGLSWSRRESPLRSRGGAALAAALLGAGFALVNLGGSTAHRPLLAAGAAALGSGQAVLSLLWLAQLPRFSYRTSYLYLLGSHGGATLLCALALQAPAAWLMPLVIGAYGASCLTAAFLSPGAAPTRSLESQALDIAPPRC